MRTKFKYSIFWLCCRLKSTLLYDTSGDANVQTSQILEPVFINSGDNPFELIKNSIKYAQIRTEVVDISFRAFCCHLTFNIRTS